MTVRCIVCGGPLNLKAVSRPKAVCVCAACVRKTVDAGG